MKCNYVYYALDWEMEKVLKTIDKIGMKVIAIEDVEYSFPIAVAMIKQPLKAVYIRGKQKQFDKLCDMAGTHRLF